MDGLLVQLACGVLFLILGVYADALGIGGRLRRRRLRRGAVRRGPGPRVLRSAPYGEELEVIVVLVAPVVITCVGVLVSATPLTMGLAAGAAMFWQQFAMISDDDSAVALPATIAVISGFSFAVIAISTASQHL